MSESTKTIRHSYRGYEIEKKNKRWFYSDNKEPVFEFRRTCGNCGFENTFKDHDWCLGELPCVMNACCGHGVVRAAYIQFSPERILRGVKALRWVRNYKLALEGFAGV